MKLACADFSFPLLEHDRVLRLIKMLGMDGVDLALMGNRSHIRPEVVREDLALWVHKLRRSLEDAELELADFFLIPWTDFETLAPNHPDPSERDASRALFTDMSGMAAELGARGMTLLPGIAWPDEPREASVERAVAELTWRVERGRDLGLRVSIEAHLGSFAEHPDDVLMLLSAVPGLELTLDFTHFVFQGLTVEDVWPLLPHARHFHVRGATPQLLQATLRMNTIDYDELVDWLIGQAYDGYLGIEYVWHPAEPTGSAYDLTNTDNVAETILMRNRVRARLTAHEAGGDA